MNFYSKNKVDYDKCFCGPYYVPEVMRAYISKTYNYQCFMHDLEYDELIAALRSGRRPKYSRRTLDLRFLNRMLKAPSKGRLVAFIFYKLVRLCGHFSVRCLKTENTF